MGAKHFLIAPLAVAAIAQGPESLTPTGPATLYDEWHGGQTLEGVQPQLLTGFRVTVLAGGQAGNVRLVVRHTPEQTTEQAPASTVSVGPWVTLPAEPGAYTFQAPRVLADYREVSYGIEQQTGGHAIVTQTRCSPEDGEDADPCSVQSVDVYTPALGAAVPDRRLAADIRRGAQLLLEPITETDADGDGAGDETEDRTNLRASATTRKLRGGRRAFDVTIENAGPRPADLPILRASLSRSPGLGTWSPACKSTQLRLRPGDGNGRGAQLCALKPLAVGETRAVRLVVPDLGTGYAYFGVSAEGRDLAPGDEAPDADYEGKRPPLWIDVDAWPDFSEQLSVQVGLHNRRKGAVRVHITRGKRTFLRRTINFRRAGGREVVLRLPRNFFRAEGPATITARSGSATAKARFEPSY